MRDKPMDDAANQAYLNAHDDEGENLDGASTVLALSIIGASCAVVLSACWAIAYWTMT